MERASMAADRRLNTGRRVSSGEGGGDVRGELEGEEGKNEDTESAGLRDKEEEAVLAMAGLRASSALWTK